MIERREQFTRDEFQTYRANSRPVIISGLMKHWPARRWSPRYLQEVCGDTVVQVLANRASHADYETHYDRHRTEMLFGDYVDFVVAHPMSNDIYLHAQNGFMQTDAGKRLYPDLPPFDYIDPSRMEGNTFLWFGPGDTLTSLHHDDCDILFVQVYGRKRWTVISPRQKHLLYNNVAVFSDVDADKPDLSKHPLYRFVGASSFVLNPGEALLLPDKWWHHVRSLDVSISLSFTNFYQ